VKKSTEPLARNHFNEIKSLIKKMQPIFSEYTFANLWLFRRQHEYEVLRVDDHLFLSGVTYAGSRVIMPFRPVTSIDKTLLNELMKDGYCIFPVAEEDLAYFPESEYRYEYQENDSDYIYTRNKIAIYPGRRLHKKRNLVKQYRTLYSYEDKPYSCGKTDDAKKVLQKWFDLSGLPIEETDFVACTEVIEHCREFGLTGQMYYANGEPSGFLFGEGLNDNTFVIHFAKGVTTFKGIYAHMYNSLANALPEKYQFINFEQDLGKETLKKAKSTYLTDTMRVKYLVYLK
jgi:hypothetical protein